MKINLQGYPTYDTTVAVTNDKVLDGLNEQIKSMITIPTGEGKMASCNVCGKQGPYKNMQRHIEANHITGVSHACDICGKVSKSWGAFSKHVSTFIDIKIYYYKIIHAINVSQVKRT